ncbi:testis-expressed protein 26-like [Tubulanus polymorphus]|uniref:testis-expressed protein 26-like n=1 Tax=Tubulanus polymorphus TaxID=672921 RepID=UPI003DA5C4BF
MATGIIESGFGGPMDPTNAEYLQLETRLGQDTLSPGFARYLEKYYKKASSADKAKCLELLTSLNIQKEISDQIKQPRPPSSTRSKSAVPLSYRENIDTQPLENLRPRSPPKRPKTAMSSVGKPQRGVYLTTYKREYPNREPPIVNADRPKSSNAFTASYDLSGPLGTTTYNGQFYKKPTRKQEPIRTGTASGQRQNNPHPAQSFMVWRFPRKSFHNVGENRGELVNELTDEVMDQVCRGKCRTTYQTDYLGIPQGVKMQEAMNLPEDWKSKVPFTLDTSTRYSYQSPEKIVPLQGNVSRYGCNRQKHKSAFGTVPTCSSRYFHVNARTTYSTDYNDSVTPGGAADLREISKTLNSEMIQKHVNDADPKEKDALIEVMNNMNQSASRRSARRNVPAPAATPTTREFNPSWHSSWTGPM